MIQRCFGRVILHRGLSVFVSLTTRSRGKKRITFLPLYSFVFVYTLSIHSCWQFLPVYVFVFVDNYICPFYVCIWFCQCLYLYFWKLNVLFSSRRCLKSQERNSISPSKVWSSQIMISRRDQSICLSSKQTQCACFHAFKKNGQKMASIAFFSQQ